MNERMNGWMKGCREGGREGRKDGGRGKGWDGGVGFGMKETPPRFQRNWTASDGLCRWLQCGQEPA